MPVSKTQTPVDPPVADSGLFTDYFVASYNGQELNDGDHVIINNYIDEGYGLGVSYISHINFVNKTNTPVACKGVFEYYNPPMESVKSNPDLWGTPSMCFSGASSIFGGAVNSCLVAGRNDAGRGTVWIPENGKDTFSFEPHLDFASPEAVSTYKLILTPMLGDDPETLKEGEPFTLYITYTTEGAPDIPVIPTEATLTVNTINGPELETVVPINSYITARLRLDEYWIISNATLNGEHLDIINVDKPMRILMDTDKTLEVELAYNGTLEWIQGETGVAYFEGTNLTIAVNEEGGVTVSGLNIGDEIVVYNLAGQIVERHFATSEQETCHPEPGIYIVRVNDCAAKLNIR
ncbi:MAG: hypothetical protein K2I91_03675 [Muribaculaceae bacterium]|nr:hypothetical protein [Muribaculaceae bacterium]